MRSPQGWVICGHCSLNLPSPSTQASHEEICRAFRRQAFKCHPDRPVNRKDQDATIKFLRLQEAYEVLRDAQMRNLYDKSLLHRIYLEVRSLRRAGRKWGAATHPLHRLCLPTYAPRTDPPMHAPSALLLQEYLRRFADLILTPQGLGLPLCQQSSVWDPVLCVEDSRDWVAAA
jgi:hypothetical protein